MEDRRAVGCIELAIYVLIAAGCLLWVGVLAVGGF